MLRSLFILLLLACLIFAAFMQWGATLTGTHATLQAQPPLNPEKILLLPASTAAVSATQPSGQAAACMEWGEFSGVSLVRATTALAVLKLENQPTQRQVEHATGYWVYIPPLSTRAEVEKKIEQIKSLGLDEYFVVQEPGKWHNAISLGVFKTGDAAQKFLKNIASKGISAARVGERTGKNTSTVFVLRNPDAAVTAKMVALQKEHPDSELKATTCNN